MPTPRARRSAVRVGMVLLGLGVGALLLLRRDERSAWEQAALTRGRVQSDPVTLSLWANELGPLLREAEALGPMPRDRDRLLPWMLAQCRINLRLEAVQRRHGKRVEPPEAMGRLPYCEDLPVVERALARSAAAKPAR
ncbi:MAG: hypothetical protein VKO65_04640 [Cyanobacteriota bacterium]|nr:hypothetical protein [Cyanobacteriota bacterium]